LDNFFQIYLGKKGFINEEFKVMITLPDEEKKSRGAKLSEIKTKLTEVYEAKEQSLKMGQINEQLGKDLIDISLDLLPTET
jgi:phenylalanyl-tRNA synthetase alpha chain